MNLVLLLCLQSATITVGSKLDVEGQLLAELFSQVIEHTGEARVERRFALGGTAVVLTALEHDEVQVVPEYTGNVARFVLKDPSLQGEALISAAVQRGYVMSTPLGFNNTYGLGLRRERARALGLSKVSQLAQHATVRAGFSPEFFSGDFGWGGLQQRLGLRLEARAMDHVVAYRAMREGSIELTDVYTTDAVIEQEDLVVLEDDVGAFDRYEGLALARTDFSTRFPKSWAALQRLGGTLSNERMVALNGRVQLQHEDLAVVAADHLKRVGLSDETKRASAPPLLRLTLEHLLLVLGSLLASTGLGLTLGVLAMRTPLARRAVIASTSALQTIPSIALLCFAIPIFGVGLKSALFALFIYGLFPIVRGVVTGLESIDASLVEMATVLAVPGWQRLWKLELPMALPSILSGLQVAAVASVGTATIAAFIGAGGYGTLVVTGLALNDLQLVMWGAVPAAVMALMLSGLFELIGRALISPAFRRSR